MPKKKKQSGNCPYCGSSSCGLGMSDFIGKKAKELENPFQKLLESPEFKEQLKHLENYKNQKK